MQRSLPQAAALLFERHRDSSSFPARIPQAVVRSVVLMPVILLMSVAAGPGRTACAEPVVTVPSRSISSVDPYAVFIREAAQRFGLPASWISAVMALESSGDAQALSPQGAMGLMQITPATWADLRIRYDLGDNPYDPSDNILAGAAYLRELHERYGSPGFLAAYNAGPGRYDDHLATGRPLPYETQLYVATLAPLIGERQADDIVAASRRFVPWQESPLFAVRGPRSPSARPLPSEVPPDRTSDSRSVTGVSALAPQTGGLFVRREDAKRLP
jgi:hypothetical protein